MAKSTIYVIGNEKFDKLEVPSTQKTVKHDGHVYRLHPHKKLFHRRWRKREVWIFRTGRSSPLDVLEISRSQKYRKVTPSALKIVVSQNIEHTFFKSLLETRGFGGLGRRRMIVIFVALGVAVIALKVMGVY